MLSLSSRAKYKITRPLWSRSLSLFQGEKGVAVSTGKPLHFKGSKFHRIITGFGPIKHVVFGKVVKGMDSVKKIELLGTADGKPSRLVKILDCGETSEQKIQDAAAAETGFYYWSTPLPHVQWSLTCSQSPIQSPSPVDRQPAISVWLISRLGPRLDDKRPSRQESSIAVPTTNPKIVKSASPSLSRSSSPGGHRGWFPAVISVLKME